tara:strand:- start:974 stop:1567 length:594 start_codon:yes stop_codon:yes gene_type:complete
MIVTNKIFYKFLFIFLIFFSYEVESKAISLGKPDAKVTIKVFSSLTCPACANFHSKVFYNLKEDFIDNGLVKFEHHPFPLDMAALNAEIILRCNVENDRIDFLGKIYEKQNLWAVGSDINKINDSLKKIGLEFNLKNEMMDNCLNNEMAQDEILNERIDAQKKYKVESTPTIFINEKKYKGSISYKEFKKVLNKSIK